MEKSEYSNHRKERSRSRSRDKHHKNYRREDSDERRHHKRHRSHSSDRGERRPKLTYQEKVEQKRIQKEAEYQAKRAKWEAERPKKPVELAIQAPKASLNPMIEVICNDRLGSKVRVKCFPTDTVKNLKLLISAHTGTRPEKIRL